MLFFLERDFPMTETQRQIFQWGKGMSFFFLKKKRLRHLLQSRPTVERTRKMFETHHRGFSQTTRHERNTRKDYEGESFEMRDNGVNSLTSPRIFHGLRYRRWMDEMWDSYKRRVQEPGRISPRPFTSLREGIRAASSVLQVCKGRRASPRKSPSVKGFVRKTCPRQTSAFQPLFHHSGRTGND